MQLLYIWIEDYKNIKRQGFNFSPLHDFEFIVKEERDGKVISGELKDKKTDEEREKLKKVYDGFFGKGISNVTAIVGENGSGKSSVLEFIRSSSEYQSLGLNISIIESLAKFTFGVFLQVQEKSNQLLLFVNKKGILNENNGFKPKLFPSLDLSSNFSRDQFGVVLYSTTLTKYIEPEDRRHSYPLISDSNYIKEYGLENLQAINTKEQVIFLKKMGEDFRKKLSFIPAILVITLENDLGTLIKGLNEKLKENEQKEVNSSSKQTKDKDFSSSQGLTVLLTEFGLATAATAVMVIIDDEEESGAYTMAAAVGGGLGFLLGYSEESKSARTIRNSSDNLDFQFNPVPLLTKLPSSGDSEIDHRANMALHLTYKF